MSWTDVSYGFETDMLPHVPVNIRVSLLVYSYPESSFSLVIMLDSLSSDADSELIRRCASFFW